jgi:hypothetical protein
MVTDFFPSLFRYVFATFQNNLELENIKQLQPKSNSIQDITAVELIQAQTRTIPT